VSKRLCGSDLSRLPPAGTCRCRPYIPSYSLRRSPAVWLPASWWKPCGGLKSPKLLSCFSWRRVLPATCLSWRKCCKWRILTPSCGFPFVLKTSLLLYCNCCSYSTFSWKENNTCALFVVFSWLNFALPANGRKSSRKNCGLDKHGGTTFVWNETPSTTIRRRSVVSWSANTIVFRCSFWPSGRSTSVCQHLHNTVIDPVPYWWLDSNSDEVSESWIQSHSLSAVDKGCTYPGRHFSSEDRRCKNITFAKPDQKTSPTLHDLVTRFQVHKCNKYCMKSYKKVDIFYNAGSASPDQSNHKLPSMMWLTFWLQEETNSHEGDRTHVYRNYKPICTLWSRRIKRRQMKKSEECQRTPRAHFPSRIWGWGHRRGRQPPLTVPRCQHTRTRFLRCRPRRSSWLSSCWCHIVTCRKRSRPLFIKVWRTRSSQLHLSTPRFLCRLMLWGHPAPPPTSSHTFQRSC